MIKLLAFSLMFTSFSVSLADEKPVEAVKYVDLQRYAGTWYEIARFPFTQQNNCHNTTATYSLNDDGTVKVTNRCRKGDFDGLESVAVAKAKVADPVSQAKLKVKFFFFAPWGDYWVIRLGNDYEYAVVSQPSRKYLWILSRTPVMEARLYDEIVKSLQEDGFDTTRLETTPQKWGGFNTPSMLGQLAPYLKLLALALGMMLTLWGVSLLLKDASIVDRFWGLGFLVLYGYQLADCRFLTFRAAMVLGLVAMWALRLSLYIHLRNRKHGEDVRYQKMRTSVGKRFWWVSLFSVFFLQGTLMWLVSAPLIFILLFPQSDQPTLFDYVGLALWTVGFLLEAMADYQMARFKRQPKNAGKVCRQGLWNLSRHPNYFGEALLWWGFGVICLTTSVGYLALYSPALMTFLLLRVSGVAHLEKQLAKTKPDYAEYVKSVPAFFPRLTGR
jgi:steroid 5-alpha reductase family enzyme/lipocalin